MKRHLRKASDWLAGLTMKLNEYEKNSLKKVKQWEQAKHKSLHKKILDATSRPVDYLIKKIGNEKLKHFENAVEKTINNLLNASTYKRCCRRCMGRSSCSA